MAGGVNSISVAAPHRNLRGTHSKPMKLSYKNISYAYGSTPVLSELNFEANAGEITCLLGPSGGGKSTLLRLAAGLEHVQKGSIEVGGDVMASPGYSLAPEKRPVGMMFQEIALFPNMTIAQNIGFGIADLPESERQARISELLEMAGMIDFSSRHPHELSGGQQQRVALLRSLAPQPKVLLMDEPFASIDITLRRPLREATRLILKQSHTTAVMVTHDPPEAMEMADTIAVLDHGRVLQVGSPQAVFEQPASASVAELFGDAQRFKVRREGELLASAYGPIALAGREIKLADGQEAELVARPSGLNLRHDNSSALELADLRFVGDAWIAFLKLHDADGALPALRVIVDSSQGLALGDKVAITAAGKEKGFYLF